MAVLLGPHTAYCNLFGGISRIKVGTSDTNGAIVLGQPVVFPLRVGGWGAKELESCVS